MDAPLVSVIIPAYKCASTLAQAVESVLAQKVNLEVIVLNDSSLEDLESVMAAYRDDPSVRYEVNPQNLGAAGTRNRGIGMAKGRYIAFLDADDYWLPGKLSKQLAAMERTGCVLCATGRELMTPEGKLTGRVIPVQQAITYRDLLRHNCINCSSVLMKAEVAREFPMHHADSHEDYIMWLEILQKYETACGIPEPLLRYRLSNTGKSGSKWNSAKMTFKVYRYMGFGIMKSCLCFASYAFNGIRKYYFTK